MGKIKIGRALIFGGFALLIVLFAWEVFAADDSMHIIEVRRNIPLADHDPVYRDYYINAGTEAGLKPHQVVTAVRKMNAKDAAGTQSFGELLIPVGQLKIIFVQSHISVAREYKLLSRDDLPMLEQMGIMIGDQIDLKGSFVDNRKSSAKTNAQKEKAPEATDAAVDTKAPPERATASTTAPETKAAPTEAAAKTPATENKTSEPAAAPKAIEAEKKPVTDSKPVATANDPVKEAEKPATKTE